LSAEPKKIDLFRLYPAGHIRPLAGETIAELKVSTRGRITIPKAIRDEFGLKSGDKIEYDPQDDGSLIARLVR
jgi:AbrB family looped-hinge helix DNA binding protein